MKSGLLINGKEHDYSGRKIRRPGGNDIIQIIVTTSCDLLQCSNCTQLLPYRIDKRFMDVDVFRKAVQSLDTWPGVIALFGGNPCSHPKFADLCQILIDEVPQQSRRGLWTNHLLGKGAIAQTTFWPHGRFNLNVHAEARAIAEMEHWLPGITILGREQPSWHSPILMHWQDMGLTYEAWVAKREQCDINQRWSGAIAERDGQAYGYMCEVSAALDGIRGENHGMLAVPGWWNRPISAFQDEIASCCDRGCGVPLRYKGHLDRDETYDVSQQFVQISLAKVKSSAQLHTEPPEATAIATDYQRIHRS